MAVVLIKTDHACYCPLMTDGARLTTKSSTCLHPNPEAERRYKRARAKARNTRDQLDRLDHLMALPHRLEAAKARVDLLQLDPGAQLSALVADGVPKRRAEARVRIASEVDDRAAARDELDDLQALIDKHADDLALAPAKVERLHQVAARVDAELTAYAASHTWWVTYEWDLTAGPGAAVLTGMGVHAPSGTELPRQLDSATWRAAFATAKGAAAEAAELAEWAGGDAATDAAAALRPPADPTRHEVLRLVGEYKTEADTRRVKNKAGYVLERLAGRGGITNPSTLRNYVGRAEQTTNPDTGQPYYVRPATNRPGTTSRRTR